MKIRIDPKHLADAVAWTAKSLPARPSVPVLAGVMLRAARNQLQVSGFDYEVSNQVGVDATVDSDGVALVSGRLLAEITKALPNKPVDLATTGSHVEIVCGSARFTLPTMPAEDYPALPDMPTRAGAVDAGVFATAVAQVAVAAGRDETLPMMTGVRIEFAGSTLAMLATDRYRLAVRELPWSPDDAGIDANALVPARILADTAKTLGPLGGDVTVALSRGAQGEGSIGFAAARRETTSRLLDGANYPPVRSLFPKPGAVAATARVNVAALTEVVKRVALVAERTTPVILSFNEDGLVVEAGGSDEARASEAMGAGCEFTGDPLTAAFNPAYLLDGLHAVGTATVGWQFVDPFKPAVMQPVVDDELDASYRYLIMPIRATR